MVTYNYFLKLYICDKFHYTAELCNFIPIVTYQHYRTFIYFFSTKIGISNCPFAPELKNSRKTRCFLHFLR